MNSNHQSILDMSNRLGLTLDPCSIRIIAQSLTKLSNDKGLTIEKTIYKIRNESTKHWQVYPVNNYDAQLYYHFQQLCMILEIV